MNTLEKKEYYEVNLPPYLQHDLDAMKEGKYPYDCLWCELYGSINAAYPIRRKTPTVRYSSMQWWKKQESPCFSCGECQIDGDISEDHAWYLRERYLDMERV